MARGFVYLVAIVDWFTRRVLSHRVSITMEAGFCVEALEEALAKHGKPETFNTDQGSQFTSEEFTRVLIDNEAYPVDAGSPRCSVLSGRNRAATRTLFDGRSSFACPIPEVVS
jgi:putative transposase